MKRIVLLLGIIALFAIILSCTPNGAEYGLVGEWTTTVSKTLYTIEITANDSIKSKTGSSVTFEGEITRSDIGSNTLVVKPKGSDQEQIINYYLSADGKELVASIPGLGSGTFKKK